MQELSIDALMLSLHGLIKERKAVGEALQDDTLDDDKAEFLSDKVLRLTSAIGEVADAYDDQRGREDHPYPSFETILRTLDPDSFILEPPQSKLS
jgi:hypothetical protein